jgi:hypothetical protein
MVPMHILMSGSWSEEKSNKDFQVKKEARGEFGSSPQGVGPKQSCLIPP